MYLAKQLVKVHGARSGWSGQSMAGRGFGSSRISRHARPEAADDATPPRRGLNPASVRPACALRNPIHSTTNEGASRQLPPCSVTRYQKRSFLGQGAVGTWSRPRRPESTGLLVQTSVETTCSPSAQPIPVRSSLSSFRPDRPGLLSTGVAGLAIEEDDVCSIRPTGRSAA